MLDLSSEWCKYRQAAVRPEQPTTASAISRPPLPLADCAANNDRQPHQRRVGSASMYCQRRLSPQDIEAGTAALESDAANYTRPGRTGAYGKRQEVPSSWHVSILT